MDGKSGLQTQNATSKPAISLSQPGLLQRTCACGGIPGLTGECEECSSKRFSRQRGPNPPASPAGDGDSESPGEPLDLAALMSRPQPNYSFNRPGGQPQRPPVVQRKLAIGQPGDRYEQEADRVAEQVMRMPEPKIQRLCPECEDELQRQPMEEEEKKEEEETLQTKPLAEQITPLVQRQTEPTEDEEKKKEEEETLQTKTASGEPPTLSSSLQNRITALRGGGQQLPQSERAFFEPRFGADFSRVRLHTDSTADSLNRSLNARAFTTGQDVFFRQGEYDAGNSRGKALLAHELTHVIQQGAKSGVSVHAFTTGQDVFSHPKESVPSSQQRRAGKSSTPIVRVQYKPNLAIVWPDPKKQLYKGAFGGRMHPNCEEAEGQGVLGQCQIKKNPTVAITHTEKDNLWTIESVTIYRLLVIGEPPENMIPKFGENVTNNKKDGVRNSQGKGYWRDVVKNLRNYKYGTLGRLEWLIKNSPEKKESCTEIHETQHDQQYQNWFKTNRSKLLDLLSRELKWKMEELMRKKGKPLSTKEVEEIAGELLERIMGQGNPIFEEEKVYQYVFKECWLPAISEIYRQAKNAGWDREPPTEGE